MIIIQNTIKQPADSIIQLGRIAERELRKPLTQDVASTIQERAITLLGGFLESHPDFLASHHISIDTNIEPTSLSKMLDSLGFSKPMDLTGGTRLYDGKYPIGHIHGGTKKSRDAVASSLQGIGLLIEQEKSEKWEYFAKHDTLTGLLNRFGFISLINTVVTEDTDCVAMCFDFNKFKSINDTYGHRMGDDALRLFASVCKEVCHKFGGTIARTGGDEFMGLFPGQDIDGGQTIALEIQERLEKRFHSQGDHPKKIRIEDVPFTVSIGITDTHQQTPPTTPKIGVTPLQDFISKLLHRADKAADAAKNHPDSKYIALWDESCDIEYILSDENKTLRTNVEALLRSIRSNDRANRVFSRELPELLAKDMDALESQYVLWIFAEHLLEIAKKNREVIDPSLQAMVVSIEKSFQPNPS